MQPISVTQFMLFDIQVSAKTVVDEAEKDGIIIFLWSYDGTIRQPFLRLFDRNVNINAWYHAFKSYRFWHPDSGDQVLLVSAPTIAERTMSAIRDALKDIRIGLELKGVGLIVHIWIHDVSRPDTLRDGIPGDWKELKRILWGEVKMDRVCLLLTGWGQISLRKGIENELMIRRSMKRDIEKGLLLERLLEQDAAVAWTAFQEVINLTRDIRKTTKWRNINDEQLRDELLQQEIDILCGRLDESEEGKKLHREIRHYFARHRVRIRPLLAQIDDEHEIGRKKKEAEAKVEYEHLLFRKTMWSFFEAIEKLGVTIGCHLQEFYGFNVNPPLPPRRSFFKGVFRFRHFVHAPHPAQPATQ